MKLAIEEIDSYFEGSDMDFLRYKENLMLKRAVERDLEIIGEAINRIIRRDSAFEDKLTNTKKIIGLRNQVIHAYDNISDENIWSILITHLPKLKEEVEALIQH
ncbi:DUF86 domain-containing protein [Zunongwangia sp. F260]|uniref:DUF86 domain-containing protein n=1 Tax=Autumnicola lenta TaxID=3075593 RepID=A0ABU3CN91_9FLAO|nr:HepT-like ribonuclease domain-containing protein [Zunongwangia sp. F260]MDT0647824.1 DUF86 domain-containing protein [Zunongwangia sp. F260]